MNGRGVWKEQDEKPGFARGISRLLSHGEKERKPATRSTSRSKVAGHWLVSVITSSVFRLIPGAGGAWPPSESDGPSCGGAGCRVSEKVSVHRAAAWNGNEPLLPLGSLSCTPDGSLLNCVCTRSAPCLSAHRLLGRAGRGGLAVESRASPGHSRSCSAKPGRRQC